MMQKKRLLRNQKQRHHKGSRCLGSSQNAAPQGLNRKPPQPASGSRSSSISKNFYILSLRTQEQTSGWKRVISFYHSLKHFALDLLAMPASQAFAERVISITGDLTSQEDGATEEGSHWSEVLSLK